MGLFDKFIKVSLRVLACFEVTCGNPGAHDRSLFVQDAHVDHEHECLDVERAVLGTGAQDWLTKRKLRCTFCEVCSTSTRFRPLRFAVYSAPSALFKTAAISMQMSEGLVATPTLTVGIGNAEHSAATITR